MSTGDRIKKGVNKLTNEKLLEKIETLEIICRGLIKRIKKLEQAKTDFPFSEKEIRCFKVGGTD